VTIGFRNFESAPTFRGTFALEVGRHLAALHVWVSQVKNSQVFVS
jgi:hypothetical protein